MKKVKKYLLLFLFFLISCIPTVSKDNIELAKKYADKATIDMIKGDFEQAKAGFNLSLELAIVPESYDGLGCLAFYNKNYKEAEYFFIRAYEQDKTYIRALSNLALLYDSLGLKEDARRVFHFALQRIPEDYRLRNNFAGFLFDYKDEESKEMAKEELRKAFVMKKDMLIKNNLTKINGKHLQPLLKENENKNKAKDKVVKVDSKKDKFDVNNFKF